MSTPANPFALRGRDIARVVALGLAQAATLVAFILLTIYVVNAFTPETVGAAAVAERNRALTALGLLVVVALVHGWLRAAEFSVSEKIGYDVIRRLRMTMYAHLQGMTPREFQHRARGGMLLRFIGDLSMLRTWLSRGLLGGLTASIILIAMLATLLALNHWIGLSIIAVLGAGAAVSLSIGRRMRRATRVMRRRRSLLIGNLDEQMNSLPVVQVFGRARGEYARLSRQNDSLNQALFRIAELRGRLRGIASATGLLAVVAVITVGMLEVRRGDATLGLVLGAILATRQLNVLVRTLGLSHDYWHRARVSRQKVQDFLDSSSRGLAPEGLDRLLVRRGRVELRDVSVPGALEAITATAEAGQLIAVTGGSGAGKSTLLRLLSRLVDPSAGEVLVDGQSLAGTTPQSAYRYVGVVSPDLPLMRGTVRRNITYATRGVADVEVQRVVYATGLAEVLAELPDGIDTWVTEGGRNLSLAQRQRIALARAVMGNPTILLLDRPTAGLDESSRHAFHEALRRHQGTTLLVTHDPDELAMADRVWCLEVGRLTSVSSGEERLDQLWLARQERSPWPHTAS